VAVGPLPPPPPAKLDVVRLGCVVFAVLVAFVSPDRLRFFFFFQFLFQSRGLQSSLLPLCGAYAGSLLLLRIKKKKKNAQKQVRILIFVL
jgi:hypothetical protein